MKGIDRQLENMNLSGLSNQLEQRAQDMLAMDLLKDHEKNQILSGLEQLNVIISLYSEKRRLTEDFLQSYDDLNLEFEVLDLLQSYKEICYEHQQAELFHAWNEWVLAYTLWRTRQQGRIKHLDYIVNCVAEIANRLRDEEDLSYLAGVTETIVNFVTDDIRQDMTSNSPSRPWRVLLLDYGIVATRSHQPHLIEAAYKFLAEHLPEDAVAFFSEGMKQMDVLNYPPQVRKVVQQFYQLYAVEKHSHKNMH